LSQSGLVGATGYLLLAAIVLLVSLLGLRIGVAPFESEAILTRWRYVFRLGWPIRVGQRKAIIQR